MPKETIAADQNQRANPTGDVQPFGEVIWARGKFVNLGVLAGGDYDEERIDRPGYFMDLDRDAVNRLIRTLRKARDQAFGSDA